MGVEPIEPYIQPELKAVLDAIEKYVEVNGRDVCMAATFIAFDKDKQERGDKDITAEGSDKVLAYGDLETLRVAINELRDYIEDNATSNCKFVNL